MNSDIIQGYKPMKVTLKTEDKVKIANGDDLYTIMQKILLRNSKLDKIKEKFYVASLAVNSTLIFIDDAGRCVGYYTYTVRRLQVQICVKNIECIIEK